MKLYNNGKPFTGYISNNLEVWRDRIAHNKPAGCIICSPPGRGKTTLACWITREYLNDYTIPVEEICEKYIGNGFKDTLTKLDKGYTNGQKLIIYDEAGDVSKRRSLSQINYEILQVLNKVRGLNMFIIMIMQDFSLLDGAILTTEVFRGGFYINERFDTYADYKAYSLNGLGKVRMQMGDSLKNNLFKNKAFDIVTPNYNGHFKNLPEEESKYLHTFSVTAKIKSFREMLDKQDGLMTQKEIISELGIVYSTFSYKAKSLGIKPVKKRGRNIYYDVDALEKIREVIR
jgi:hypothetical protein